MTLAISNIAWDADEDPDVLARLRELGVAAIEIAPTKLWPDWEGASVEAARAARVRLDGCGFSVSSFQAILFARPDLQLFADAQTRAALLDHIGRVAELAQAFGARPLVFGAPKNRDPGALDAEATLEIAAEFFRAAGELCAFHDTVLCLEANPSDYGCRFITRWREAADLVRRVDHPGFRLHLDAACTLLAGDDLAEAVRETGEILAHVHISEPQLGDFSAPQAAHAVFGAALNEAAYQGWRVIEMRRNEQNPLAAIETAVNFTRGAYE